MAVKAKRKGEYHHGDLRRALIDAALQLARKHGARAVTLSEAARLAGVSVSAPYRHFPEKEALLAAAAEESFDLFTAALRSGRTAGTTPRERLLGQGRAYCRFGRRYPERIDLMFGMGLDVGAHPSLLAASDRAWNELLEAVREQVQAGLVPAEQLELTARQLWGIAHGCTVLARSDEDPEEVLVPTVEQLLAGKALPARQPRERPSPAHPGTSPC